MSIRWDTRNKRWRFEFDRYVGSRRHRASKLLPKGWSRAQADAFDQKETGRLWAVATGTEREDALIDTAVILYLKDKTHLKSYKATAEHLNEIAPFYSGRTISELAKVSAAISAHKEGARGPLSPATIRNRLACLKSACRWAWKRHGLTEHDPTTRMILPTVRNERHTYASRADMLKACRACTNWPAQIAIRIAFYTGMRLGEIRSATADGNRIVMAETKNGDRRSIPAHPKIRHLLRFLPLTTPKITIQRAWERAREAAGIGHVRFHDLRHSAASEMVNAGVDLYRVGQVLGHRDPRSTARYSHLRADVLAEAVGAIGRKRA